MLYNLIIVEDEDNTREGLGNYIDWESMGYQLLGLFCNGLEVIEYLERSKERVHVILSDIKMDYMTGIQLARHIYGTYPEIRVVFLSAHRDFEYARQAVSLNVIEYLLKPTQISQIREVFSQIKSRLDFEMIPTLEGDTKPVDNSSITSNGYQLIEKARQYIEENFEKEECSLTNVANHVNLVPSYFSRLFKSETGINFLEYLTKLRVNAAIELLDKSNLRINEICLAVGYESQRYFTKVFKKQMGCLPTEYRKRRR